MLEASRNKSFQATGMPTTGALAYASYRSDAVSNSSDWPSKLASVLAGCNQALCTQQAL